jgi:uncharacterized membrane protein (DUF485 family)
LFLKQGLARAPAALLKIIHARYKGRLTMSSLPESAILCSEEYRELSCAKSKIIIPLTAIMLIAYYSFVLLIAFVPELLARPVGDGPMSAGILLGLFLILLTFVLTGIYVHYANTVLEPLHHKLKEKFGA